MSERDEERDAIVKWGNSFAKTVEADLARKLTKLPRWERDAARQIYDMGVKAILLVVGGIEAGRHRDAKAIEARSDETRSGSAEGESAVAQPFARRMADD